MTEMIDTEQKTVLVVTVDYDLNTETPCDGEGAWELVSFRSRDHGYQNPYELLRYDPQRGEARALNIGLQRQLDTGTAFFVSRYEHGGVVWGLQGEVPACRWDTSEVAGLLIWKWGARLLPKGLDARRAMARDFLKTYTEWANGECFAFMIDREATGRDPYVETGDRILLDASSGYIGPDALAEVLAETLIEFRKEWPGCRLVWEGDAWRCVDHLVLDQMGASNGEENNE